MFIAKIKGLYPTLTASEMRIGDYLLANIQRMNKMTSSELAESLGVGQTTVIRFSKKLGYRSFTSMMDDILSSDPNEEQGEIQLSDSTYATFEKIKEKYIQSIDVAFRSNSCEAIEKAAKYIDRAKNIVCFGYQATGGFANYLSESLIELGKSSYQSSSIIETKQRIRLLDCQTDCVVMVSKSGETKELCELANFAKENNIPVIAISNIGKTTLSDLADVRLSFLYDQQKTRLKAYTQNGGLLFTIDTLILNVYKKDYKKYRENSLKFMKFSRPNEYEE